MRTELIELDGGEQEMVKEALSDLDRWHGWLCLVDEPAMLLAQALINRLKEIQKLKKGEFCVR